MYLIELTSATSSFCLVRNSYFFSVRSAILSVALLIVVVSALRSSSCPCLALIDLVTAPNSTYFLSASSRSVSCSARSMSFCCRDNLRINRLLFVGYYLHLQMSVLCEDFGKKTEYSHRSNKHENNHSRNKISFE